MLRLPLGVHQGVEAGDNQVVPMVEQAAPLMCRSNLQLYNRYFTDRLSGKQKSVLSSTAPFAAMRNCEVSIAG
jgi:hypothetical protein